MQRIAAENGFDLARSYAYGDSGSDGWMLGAVGRPAAVNPSPEFKRIADLRHWPVFDLDAQRGRRCRYSTANAATRLGHDICFTASKRRTCDEPHLQLQPAQSKVAAVARGAPMAIGNDSGRTRAATVSRDRAAHCATNGWRSARHAARLSGSRSGTWPSSSFCCDVRGKSVHIRCVCWRRGPVVVALILLLCRGIHILLADATEPKTFTQKFWHFWRHWYPHLFFLFCFEELAHLVHLVVRPGKTRSSSRSISG